jgi:hypothetical protein
MHRPGDEVNVVDTSKRLDNRAFGDMQAGWYWRGLKGRTWAECKRNTTPIPPC